MDARRTFFLLGAAAALGPCLGEAQPLRPGGRGGYGPGVEDGPGLIRGEGGTFINEDTVRTAREAASHSTGTPEWSNPPGFEKDVFAFARIIFKTDTTGVARPVGRGRGTGPWLGWWVDFPDADLNFSYRLQQLTSAKVDPDGRVLKLTDPELADYPLIYVEHAGYIRLRDTETEILRKYLRNGGALLVNDFWGALEWDGFAAQMKRVLPEGEWTELTTDHPLFHCVFDIKGPMSKLQVPTLQFWNPAYDPDDPNSHLQRVFRGEGFETMHVRAWLDERQRITVLAILNSDVSDGWEREGENTDYFHTFSEKISYPLGINIVFYLMTH